MYITTNQTSKPKMASALTNEMLREARQHFEKLKLQEAQDLFHQILDSFKEKAEESRDYASNLSDDTLDIVNGSLIGLAEIHMKQGHSQRHEAFAWFHQYLCAIAYMRESVYLCAQNEFDDEGWRNIDVTNKKVKAEQGLNRAQNVFIRQVRCHLLSDNGSSLNEKWLENFVQYINDTFSAKKTTELLSPVKAVPSKAEQMHTKRKETKERKMDFAKIQKAISKLVRNITQDIRSRYRRKKLSEETLRRSVSCEILTIMSPITDDKDLEALFERVIAEDEEGQSPSTELDVEMGHPHNNGSRTRSRKGSTDSLDDILDGAKLNSSQANNNAEGDRQIKEGPFNTSFTGASTSMQHEGSINNDLDHLTDHVTEEEPIESDTRSELTLWKSYIRSPRPTALSFKSYRLKNFEEMPPLTETSPVATMNEENQTGTVPASHVFVYPLTASKLYETFGHVMSILASTVADSENLDAATELYKYSLGLIHQCTNNPAHTTIIANILKNLGIIKCNKGDLVSGCQLLQEAMQLFKAVSTSSDDDISIAGVWCELGRAFLQEREHVTSLFNHVMIEVRNEIDSEFREEVFELACSDTDDSDSSQGDSYSVHVHEAMECLQSAIDVLDKLNPNTEEHGPILIEVLTKLGDCNIVVGDYTKAVEYYEEVLTICKNIMGSSSLENNAHVLCMLGVANFLLGNHPKAVTMLETASILQKHIYSDQAAFEVAFTLTMLGSAFYKMKQYHRCIVWCLKSSELSIALGGKIETLDYNRAWFIIQTFFTLGYAYYTLDFFDKAICYLEIGQKLLSRCVKPDTKQNIQLLKVLGDCFVATEDYTKALEMYEEAMTLASLLGDERSSTALQNQLLNCMAGIQVNIRQYSDAAAYLEQALDHQRNVESSIKGDLVGLQYKLGVTYTMSGDIDKAVDCFEECLDTLNDAPGSPGKESVHALGKLANLYHVKGLMQEDNEFMEELLGVAHKHFTKATEKDCHSAVCIQYANFLMQQGQAAEALEVLLPFLFRRGFLAEKEVTYSGVEQAILPDHLQHETDDIDAVTMETKVLAYFLGILCFKELQLTKDADDCLEAMYKLVLKSSCYFSHVLMGYAFMEMSMYNEAAECFAKASQLQRDNALPTLNCCLCLYLHAYQTITKSLKHIIEYYVPKNFISFSEKSAKPQEMKPDSAAPIMTHKVHIMEQKSLHNRDSGYFEHADVEKCPSLSSSPANVSASTRHSHESSLTSSHESDSSYLTDQSMLSDDRVYHSDDSLQKFDTPETKCLTLDLDNSQDVEVWETIDSKGNVIGSTIYEVENNGNYETESTSSFGEYNANYRQLYESVQSALNERWVNKDLLDNDTINKLKEAGYVSPTSPQRSISSQSRFGTQYHSPEKMSLQVETEYQNDEEIEEVWEVFEETVDTPPELLAILQQQRYG